MKAATTKVNWSIGAAIIIITTALILPGSAGEARVFDWKTQNAAAYFGGTYGLSNMGHKAWASDGSGADTDQKISTELSGELGFMITSQSANLRFGAEYLLPSHPSNVIGSVGGTSEYTLDSKTSAIIPKADIEIVLSHTLNSKWLLGLGAGYAMATMENRYAFTAAGAAKYSLSDFTEKGTGTGAMGEFYTAYEFIFTDAVTLSLSVGYRYLKIGQLKRTDDVHDFGGLQAKDSVIKNSDGLDRQLDLGGVFSGAIFRFYF